ncbi:MAG TPA: patatin-like phospholipase family protein [Nocardioidaceae bacterium]|nr:patatin-like phospholipase family protein [Nocardioidaceae bacterium]
MATSNPDKNADLVLEGGGVKGIALVGAVTRLAAAGYRFPRVAGTSAGAVAGCVIAALGHAGEDLSQLEDIARSLDYRKFRDRGLVGRLLGPLGFLADAVSVVAEDGAYEGDYLHDWVAGVLADLGVRTFGDLRTGEPEGGAHGDHIAHRYALVVMASDISRKRLVQLPWDYPEYGLDPDEQHVADAVRASASIPYFFEPVTLSGVAGTSTLVDGGLVSNYPIDIFDRPDRREPRWPTIGVHLDALGIGDPAGPVSPVDGPVRMGVALIETALEAGQAEHVLDPCNLARSINVDTGTISGTDFDLSAAQRDALLAAGADAADAFLSTWDFDRWRARCR